MGFVKTQHEQIQVLNAHGVEYLRRIDNQIPFLKLVDAMREVGISLLTIDKILLKCHAAGLLFIDSGDLPSETLRSDIRSVLTDEFRRIAEKQKPSDETVEQAVMLLQNMGHLEEEN